MYLKNFGPHRRSNNRQYGFLTTRPKCVSVVLVTSMYVNGIVNVSSARRAEPRGSL